MLAPQSDEEIRPVVDGLRKRDPLLDIRWEPNAVMVEPGHYSVAGGKHTAPKYDGRWQIIRHDTPGLHDREYVVMCTVTKPERIGRRQILFMVDKGEYAPVGEWLLEFIDTWDRAARRATEVAQERERIDQAVEDSINDDIESRAAHQEALEKVYAEQGGGEYWMGRGFGKGKKTQVTPQATTGVET